MVDQGHWQHQLSSLDITFGGPGALATPFVNKTRAPSAGKWMENLTDVSVFLDSGATNGTAPRHLIVTHLDGGPGAPATPSQMIGKRQRASTRFINH